MAPSPLPVVIKDDDAHDSGAAEDEAEQEPDGDHALGLFGTIQVETPVTSATITVTMIDCVSAPTVMPKKWLMMYWQAKATTPATQALSKEVSIGNGPFGMK